MWFRVEWRSRWRALLGLALLIAFATASVTTATAGARRGSTAVDRLLDVTEPMTLAALVNRGPFDWDVVRAMPQVEALSAFAVSGFDIEGLGDSPERSADYLGGFPMIDDQAWKTLERPVVLDGRLPDTSRADEVAVTSNFVDFFGKGVGDTVTLRLYTPAQIDSGDEGTPTGPAVDTTIVGVIRSLWFSDEAEGEEGRLQPSPGLYTQYPENIVGTTGQISVNAIIRLRDGAVGIDEFEREFTRITGIENVEYFDMAEAAQHRRNVSIFEARALLLLALTALVASLVLIGVAISRFVAASFGNLEVLQAFGLTPAQVRLAVAATPASASVVGVVLGGAMALWASRWFPIGSAALVEPAPGVSFDPLVFLLPLLVVPALVVVACLWSVRQLRQVASATSSGPSAVESMTASWPLKIGLGTRFALSGRSTPNSASGRPALIGAVLGVTGVVAALTFAHGIADATDGYERFGQTYELGTFLGFNGQDFTDPASTLNTIAADPDVDGVLDAANDVGRSGSGPVSLFTYAPVGDPIDVVILEGRLPTTRSEIALGPTTAEEAGVGVGDTIEITGPLATETLTVTGLTFLPAGPHNSYAGGGWVLPQAFDELFDGFRFHFGLVSTAPGADPQAVTDRLAEAEILLEPGPINAPEQRGELAELQTVPLLLAAFLAVLGIGAVAHTLASTARRRRHDVAMLRALGMRPSETASLVYVQAGVIALVGLVIGLPLGAVLGRSLWRSIALDTPVQFVPPESLLTVFSVALAVAALAALLAIWPSRRLASMHLGGELRYE